MRIVVKSDQIIVSDPNVEIFIRRMDLGNAITKEESLLKDGDAFLEGKEVEDLANALRFVNYINRDTLAPEHRF